jgi:uncharacterized phiE125 gp8 family phage protein
MTIDLELAKAHVRVTHNDEDVLIGQYMASAQSWVERYTGLMLVQSTVVDTFSQFGDYLELSRGPFVSLTSIAYVDSAGDNQTVTGARVRDGKIYPPEGGWPVAGEYTPITATYVAGFDQYEVPEELVQAQLLLIGHFYQNREGVAEGSFSEVPLAVEALAGPFRMPTVR